MILTYKYRLKIKNSKAKLLKKQAFAVNQIWNYCNAYQEDIEQRYRAGAPKRKWPSHFEFTALTAGVSRDLGVHAQTVGEVCRQYVQSRDKNRGRLKFRISKEGPRRSLGWIPFRADSCQTAGNSITYLGKIYRWFGSKRRPLPATAKGGAFVEDSRGRWWVAFHVEVSEAEAHARSGTKVGIDLGLKTLATLSNGVKYDRERHFLKYEKQLATAQRAGKKGRTKAIHANIANARKDQAHKITTELAREYEFIAVGDVKLSQGLMAKAANDVGHSSFRNMLRYKCQKAKGVVIKVSERNTTLTCSACESTSGPKGIAGLEIRDWECVDCETIHDRDVNSAKNILKLGLSAQALVEGSRSADAKRIGTRRGYESVESCAPGNRPPPRGRSPR